MTPRNWISQKLSYALSVWAGCLTIIIGLIGRRTLSLIFTRSIIAFVLFGILGYGAGWVIHSAMEPRLAFINEDDEEEDGNGDGEAMESL